MPKDLTLTRILHLAMRFDVLSLSLIYLHQFELQS